MKDDTPRHLYSTPDAEVVILQRELREALDALNGLATAVSKGEWSVAMQEALRVLQKHKHGYGVA